MGISILTHTALKVKEFFPRLSLNGCLLVNILVQKPTDILTIIITVALKSAVNELHSLFRVSLELSCSHSWYEMDITE